MNLRLRDTVDQVQRDLQLTPQDAALYVHLCVAGPAKVSDLADALHVHRNDVYRTTERLVERGLVQPTVERPARYVAITPDQIFDEEINKRLKSVENLRKSRVEVMALVDQLRSVAPAAPKGVYKILQGRPAIYAQRDQMLLGAKREIQWISSHVAAIHHASISGTIQMMADRASEGVELRVLVRTTPETVHHLDPFRGRAHVSMREFGIEVPVRFWIVDGKELLMWVVNDPSDSLYAQDEVAIYTTAPGFVEAQQQFADTAWSRAPPIASS